MADHIAASRQAQRDGRLRPVRTIDPLANIGLPSKGDTSLSDPQAQEHFFSLILECDRKIDAELVSAAGPQTLEGSLSNLSVDEAAESRDLPPRKIEARIEVLHHALRALRESLTARHRADTFAQHAYLATVRIGVKHRAWETYLPTLLQLLRVIRQSPEVFLGDADVAECLQFEILDLACRQDDLLGAFGKWHIASQWVSGRGGVDAEGAQRLVEGIRYCGQILAAIVHGNALQFWRTRACMPALQQGIIEYAAAGLRKETVAIFAKAYFAVGAGLLETCLAMPCDEAIKGLGLDWELEGLGKQRTVIVRKPKTSAARANVNRAST